MPTANLVTSAGPGGPQSYTYDAEGRLLSVVTPQGTWTYEYDVFGNRVATVHNGVRTEYLIDPTGLGDVVAEYDGSGNLRAHYVQGSGLVSRSRCRRPGSVLPVRRDRQHGPAHRRWRRRPDRLQLSSLWRTSSGHRDGIQPVHVRRSARSDARGNGLDYMRNRWYDSGQGRSRSRIPSAWGAERICMPTALTTRKLRRPVRAAVVCRPHWAARRQWGQFIVRPLAPLR